MKAAVNSLTILSAILMLGCSNSPSQAQRQSPGSTERATADQRIIGYVNGKPVFQEQLYRVMAPQAGGPAFAELVLDRLLEQRLAEAGIELDSQSFEREQQMLLTSLADDEDQAVVLLRQMRMDRGLDDARFALLLKRNAALRALIRDEITIADSAVRQAYALAYGPRYRVRLIVAANIQDARQARQKAIEGSDFSQLALEYSTDSSRAQGGLLSPISPADTSYPKAIRDVLPSLKQEPAQQSISPILALDAGFAILKLEEVIPAKQAEYESVEEQLRRGVQLQLERVRMQQLARTLLQQANVVVIDPILQPAWQEQEKAILQSGDQE